MRKIGLVLQLTKISIPTFKYSETGDFNISEFEVEHNVFLVVDLIVVFASVVVLSFGSNGQVFATSAIRQVVIYRSAKYTS